MLYNTPARKRAGKQKSAPVRSRRTIKVLVASNIPLLRAGMRATLKAPGLSVVGEASDENEALRLIQDRPTDVVVAHFPEAYTRNLDLATRIKERNPTTAVLVLTKSESTLFLARAIAIGCSGYFLEHVEPKDLVKAVRAVARGECVIEPARMQNLLAAIAQQYDGRVAPTKELSAVEREILQLLTEGKTNRQIAEQLRYSVATIKNHVQRIIQKLEVSDRTQAAVKAIRLGLVQ